MTEQREKTRLRLRSASEHRKERARHVRLSVKLCIKVGLEAFADGFRTRAKIGFGVRLGDVEALFARCMEEGLRLAHQNLEGPRVVV